jgi:uncharacterized membrane protein YeaQ/YmgE (transglycosylase-associated protein family)
MGLISWLIFGALVGWIASKIVGTDDQQGWILNIVLGIVGALVGGFVYSGVVDDEFGISWSVGSFIVALLGAVVVSWGFAYFTRRR